MTMSPSSWLEISFSARSWSLASRSATTLSTAWMAIERFSHALSSEPRSFWRSNGSRRPSRLTTWGSTSSMYSYVVYRRWHFRHSRRRRMNSPSRPTRESTTRSSVCPQKGHFTGSPQALRVERKARGQLLHFATYLRLRRGIAETAEHAVDEGGNLRHLGLAHAARGHGRRAQTHPARDHGPLGVEGDAVLVHGDPRPIERFLRVLAGDALGRQVDEEEMGVGAAGDQPVAEGQHGLGERLGVLDDLGLVGTPLGRLGLPEGHGLGGDHMHE